MDDTMNSVHKQNEIEAISNGPIDQLTPIKLCFEIIQRPKENRKWRDCLEQNDFTSSVNLC